MSDKTGGAAFPFTAFRTPDGMVAAVSEPGMTLRDYFAGQAAGECFAQALKRGFEHPQHITNYTQRAAYWAYELADALLAERSK